MLTPSEKKDAFIAAKGTKAMWDADFVSVPTFPLPWPDVVLHPASTATEMYVVSLVPRAIQTPGAGTEGAEGAKWIKTAFGAGTAYVYHQWFDKEKAWHLIDMANETGLHAYLVPRDDRFDLFHGGVVLPLPDVTHRANVSDRPTVVNLTRCNLRKNQCYLCRAKGLWHESYCFECAVLTAKFRLTIPTATRAMAPVLRGQKVLVTGGRIKIGMGTALACLRLGAEVTVTSRFGTLARAAYAAEPDYDAWADRLTVFEADFLSATALLRLTKMVRAAGFTVIVQNAAQTVKNDAYTRALSAMNGTSGTPGVVTQLLTGSNPGDEAMVLADGPTHPDPETLAAMHTAAMQTSDGPNSWFLAYDEVSLGELIENLKINVVTPFLVIQAAGPHLAPGAVVINVTSSEGAFLWKSDGHIHNNMCKAAIDQMTLTLHQDFRKRGIRMYAIDPGFYSSANPNAVPPLRLEDSVARMMQPILATTVEKGWRWKDYVVRMQ